MNRFRLIVVTRFLLVFLAVAAVCNCSTLGNSKFNQEDFATAVDAFNTALRWGDYKTASAFIFPESQEEFWRKVDSMDGRIRLTDYEIRNATWNTEGHPIEVFIRYQYYYMNNPELRSQTVHQQWRYNEQIENWQIAATGLDLLVDQ